MLYAQTLKRPSLLSARSDAELLVVTAQAIDHYMAGTPEKRTISDITKDMASTASTIVDNSNLPRELNPEITLDNSPSTLPSRNIFRDSVFPRSTDDHLPTGSDTPLSFYFSISPEHRIRTPDTNPMEQHHRELQTEHQTTFPASDEHVAQISTNLAPQNFQTIQAFRIRHSESKAQPKPKAYS
jgi:hypothetical protein